MLYYFTDNNIYKSRKFSHQVNHEILIRQKVLLKIFIVHEIFLVNMLKEFAKKYFFVILFKNFN